MRTLSPSKMHPVYPGPVVQEAQVVNFAAHFLRHRIKHLHASGIKKQTHPTEVRFNFGDGRVKYGRTIRK